MGLPGVAVFVVAVPDPSPVVVPVVGEPGKVPPIVALPAAPVCEPVALPGVPPTCASAIVLERASAPANVIVLSFISHFLC
jgi:hypothetical protein